MPGIVNGSEGAQGEVSGCGVPKSLEVLTAAGCNKSGNKNSRSRVLQLAASVAATTAWNQHISCKAA